MAGMTPQPAQQDAAQQNAAQQNAAQPSPSRVSTETAQVVGLVLAAGAGSRYGMPKALVVTTDGTSWLASAVATLAAGGCSPVIVVLGARADEAEALLRGPDPATTTEPPVLVRAENWADGVSASLRAGLLAAADLRDPTDLRTDPVAVAIVPVDVPGLTEATVRRLIEPVPGGKSPIDPHTLRQARFGGRPGHPVVIGRAHWGDLVASLAGDTGARPYLLANDVEQVDCGDLETGDDVDVP